MRRLLAIAIATAATACAADMRDTEPAPVARTTWYQDVGPIISEHCSGCHREGGIGPFELTSYDSAAERAGQLLDAVERGIMPPWSATTATDCAPTRSWKHDPRLSAAEMDTLRAWIDDDTPAGEVAPLPIPPSLELPNATHTLTPTTGFVTTGNTDEFMCFVLDPQITTTKYLEGWDVRPGNPEVVHHVIMLTLGAEVMNVARNANAIGIPLPCGAVPMTEAVGAWTPGQGPTEAPLGVGMELAAGAGILLQMHYHPGGRATNAPDATGVALRLSDTVPAHRFVVGGWGNSGAAPSLLPGPGDRAGVEFRIPANARDHTETMRFTIDMPNDPTRRIPMFLMQPHQHYIGTELQLRIHRANPPPGEPTEECLVNSDWNFDWQRSYQYDVPIEQLPTFGHGDMIEVKCTYDNTLNNPFVQRGLSERGLVAPIDVVLGEQSLDEMCLALVSMIE